MIMKKHLVLAGGGHAHMVTLANLHTFIKKGYGVTVIGPSPYHYYSGMGPGMLGGIYRPEEIRFATKHVVEKQGGTFILDRITRIDPKTKKILFESENSLTYDVLSFNVGSYVPDTIISENKGNIFPVKPIEKLLAAQKKIKELVRRNEAAINIVGGGPAAAEICGNIWRLARDQQDSMPKIRIFAAGRFMSRFPESIRKYATKSLSNRGIEIFEESPVLEIRADNIILESGKSVKFDIIFLALGVRPSPVFETSGLPTGPDGGLLVNRYLQSTEHPELFGGGDCIYFKEQPLDKVGVYAVRENSVLYHNLMASLDETELTEFDPGGDYLLIFNMGDGSGILKKKWFTSSGKAAFLVKDYIDRKFMKKFQSIE